MQVVEDPFITRRPAWGPLHRWLVPTIQKKLLLVMLAVALAPALLFGVVAYQRASSALMNQVGERLVASSRLALSHIDRTFGLTRENVNSWARLEMMQALAGDDDAGAVSTLLQDYQAAYGVFSTLVATNADGVVVAAGDRDLLGIDVSDSEWFKQARRLRSPVMGALRLDPVLGGYGIRIAVPVLARGGGQVIGVLAASFDWTELLKLVSAVEVADGPQTPSAYALLIDREGFIIAAPDFILARDEGSVTDSDQLRVFGKRWSAIDSPAFLDDLLSAPRHRFIREAGRDMLAVNMPTAGFQALDEMGWSLIMVRDAGEALAELNAIRERALWLALLVFVVSGLAAVVFSRQIGLPIQRLSDWASQLAAGRLDMRLDIASRDEIGELAGSLDNMRAALKASMDEITEAKERYQAVLSSIDCVVWEAEIQPFRLSLVSGKVESVIGYSSDAVRTQIATWRQWIHPDHHADVAATFARIIASMEGTYLEFKARHAKGHWIWFKAFVSVVVQASRVVGVRGVMVDITDLQRASEEMQKARDLAIATAENRSRFLAIISHEIRTPMNGVMGMLDLLRESSAVRDDHRDTLQTAWQSSRNLLALVNDVMDYSRLENGEMEFRYERIVIRELLATALSMVAPEAYRKGLDVGAVLEASLPESLVCDVTKVRQVLSHLLSNAVKFTHHGSILLWAELLPGNRLYVEVKDTGIGIDAADQVHLFQAFGVVDASTTRAHDGAGLGLSLAQRLLGAMGGRVGVKSIKGLGSSFYFELPVDVLPGRSVVAEQKEMFREHHSGAAILLIGDLPATQMVMSLAAQQWGLEFHWEPKESRISRHLDDILSVRDYRWIFIGQEMSERFWDRMTPYLQQQSRTRIIQLRLPTEKYGQRPLPHLYVPFSNAALADAMLGRREPLPVAEGEKSTDRDVRLLLVDDNEVNRKVAVGFLRKMGYEVDTAEDGQQALDAINSRRYDFVFMDCQMPVMDGYEATRHIKKLFPHLPVVAVTANAMEGDRERCLAAGMDDYMSKPVRRDKLQDMLDRWLVAGQKTHA